MKTALLYASQIAAALAEAHGKGIVHRDLKPGNIMIGKSGVKVLDFGLAKSGQDDTVTGSHMVIGTPAYMAPEQREGKPADARADIYAFGCMLYEMLTGTRAGPQRKRIRPRKLEKIVSRCLEEDPARRWQSAAELQRELAAVTAAKARDGCGRAAAAALWHCAPPATSTFTARRNSRQKTRSSWAEFENKTGDPVFDQTLRQGLAVQLEQSPFLALVSDQQHPQTLHFMNRPLGDAAHSESRGRSASAPAAPRFWKARLQARKPVRFVAARQELPYAEMSSRRSRRAGKKKKS